MPSRNSPDCTRFTSSPSASHAAPTAFCVMVLERRNRGWARNAGGTGGGGTERRCSGFSQPGRETVCTGRGAPVFNAELKAGTPQPAGETAPSPWTKIFEFIEICSKPGDFQIPMRP